MKTLQVIEAPQPGPAARPRVQRPAPLFSDRVHEQGKPRRLPAIEGQITRHEARPNQICIVSPLSTRQQRFRERNLV